MKSIAIGCMNAALVIAYIWASAAWAQQPAAETDTTAPTERAKRQADNPYKWIMIMDDKPRPKKDEPKEKEKRAPAPATAAPVATPRSSEPRVPASQQPSAASAAARPAPVAPQPVPELSETPSPAPDLAAAAPAPREPEPVVEEPLRPIKQVQPEMTRQIAAANITEGRVRAKFTVEPDGSVTKPEIVNSSSRVLNSAVLAALAQWKYAPIKTARDAMVEFAFDFSR